MAEVGDFTGPWFCEKVTLRVFMLANILEEVVLVIVFDA